MYIYVYIYIILYYIILSYIILSYIKLSYIKLSYIILSYIILSYIILYYIILYYIIYRELYINNIYVYTSSPKAPRRIRQGLSSLLTASTSETAASSDAALLSGRLWGDLIFLFLLWCLGDEPRDRYQVTGILVSKGNDPQDSLNSG